MFITQPFAFLLSFFLQLNTIYLQSVNKNNEDKHLYCLLQGNLEAHFQLTWGTFCLRTWLIWQFALLCKNKQHTSKMCVPVLKRHADCTVYEANLNQTNLACVAGFVCKTGKEKSDKILSQQNTVILLVLLGELYC